MIYIYGTGKDLSIVYQEQYLSEAAKARATLVVDKLPPKATPANHSEMLVLDEDGLRWEYTLIEEEVIEENINEE